MASTPPPEVPMDSTPSRIRRRATTAITTTLAAMVLAALVVAALTPASAAPKQAAPGRRPTPTARSWSATATSPRLGASAVSR
jgi:hypothetical protein